MRHGYPRSAALVLTALSALSSGCSGTSTAFSPPAALLSTGALAAVRSNSNATSPNAGPADAFVNALGVDTHFSYTNTVYKYLTSPAPSGNTIISSLKALGVRHLRDGNIDTDPQFCPAFKTVIQNGTDVDAITTTTTGPTGMQNIVKCLGSGLFALEAPNELDQSGDPTWAQDDVTEMQTIFSNRGIAYPSKVNLFGPSLTSEAAYMSLAAVKGDAVKNYLDDANAHVYLSAREPETKGWGGTDQYGTYGAITTVRNWAVEVASPGKPWAATETGYPDAAADSGYVAPAIKSKYLVRDMFQHRIDGAQYIYIYELADENGSWGLMDGKLYPKPAYTALRNTIAILTDPGPVIARSYFQYVVAANGDVKHLLFKKRDGSFWLCLWQNDEGWNPNTSQPINVAPTTATITFASAPSVLTKYQINAGDGSVTLTSIKPAAAVTTTVTDSPAIIQIGATAKKPVLTP